MNVREIAEKYNKEIIDLRREFHKHPELNWKEIRTGNGVEEELKKIGIEVERVAQTGVVVTLRDKEDCFFGRRK